MPELPLRYADSDLADEAYYDTDEVTDYLTEEHDLNPAEAELVGRAWNAYRDDGFEADFVYPLLQKTNLDRSSIETLPQELHQFSTAIDGQETNSRETSNTSENRRTDSGKPEKTRKTGGIRFNRRTVLFSIGAAITSPVWKPPGKEVFYKGYNAAYNANPKYPPHPCAHEPAIRAGINGAGAQFDFYRLHAGTEPGYDPDWLLEEFEAEMNTLKGFDADTSWTSIDYRNHEALSHDQIKHISHEPETQAPIAHFLENTYPSDPDAVKMIIAPYDADGTAGFVSEDFPGHSFLEDYGRILSTLIHEGGHEIGLMHTLDWDVMDGGVLYHGDHFGDSSHRQWEEDIYPKFVDES